MTNHTYTHSHPLRLTIFGQPRTKSNIRSSVWSKKSKRVIQFKDPEVAAYELGIAGQARQQLEKLGHTDRDIPVFLGPVVASFRFYFQRRPTNSDVANYFKSAADALNGIVWLDDKLIVRIHGEKFHDKLRPRIEVEVWEFEEVSDENPEAD